MRGTMYIKKYGQPPTGRTVQDASHCDECDLGHHGLQLGKQNLVLLYTADSLKSPISQSLAGSSILQILPSDPNRLFLFTIMKEKTSLQKSTAQSMVGTMSVTT